MVKVKQVWWVGDLGLRDDYGDTYKDIMVDGATIEGPWANMTERSWRTYGIGRLGVGYGQMYQKQPDGRWLKIKG